MQQDSTILVVDPDRTSGDLLAFRCRQMGLSVKAVTSGEVAVDCLQEKAYSLVIVGDVNARNRQQPFVDTMATVTPYDSIPTIVLHDGGRHCMERCRDLGHLPVQRSIKLWNELEPIIRRFLDMPAPNIMRRRQRSLLKIHGKVLCIDDDPRMARSMQIKLRKYGLDVLKENNGVAGFYTAVRHTPNLIITEFALPEGLGSHVLGRLRDCDIQIPVLFLTNMNPDAYTGLVDQLSELGACGVVRKPIDWSVLLPAIRQHINLPVDIFAEIEDDNSATEPSAESLLPTKNGVHEMSPHIPVGKKTSRNRRGIQSNIESR